MWPLSFIFFFVLEQNIYRSFCFHICISITGTRYRAGCRVKIGETAFLSLTVSLFADMQGRGTDFYRPSTHFGTHRHVLWHVFSPQPRTRDSLYGSSCSIFTLVLLFALFMYRLGFSFSFHKCSLILMSRRVCEIISGIGDDAGCYRLRNFSLILIRHQYAESLNQPYNSHPRCQRHPFCSSN